MNGVYCPTETFAAGGPFWKRLISSADLVNDNPVVPCVKTSLVARPDSFGVLTEMWHTGAEHQTAWSTTRWRLFVGNELCFLLVHRKSSNVLLADGRIGIARPYGAPTGFNTNAKLFYVQDQADSLFNYDYGIKWFGALTPTKYLK